MDNIPIHQLFGNQTRDKNILGFAEIPLSPTLSLPLETILSHLCKKETHLPNLTRKEVVSKRLHMTFPRNQAFGTRNTLDVYQAANFPWFQHCSSKSLQLRKSWLERWPWKRKPDNSPSWQSLKAKSELFFWWYGKHVIGFPWWNIRWHRETFLIYYSSNQSWMNLSRWMY